MLHTVSTDTIQPQPRRSIREPRLSRRSRTWLERAVAYLVMSAIAFVFMIPLFWMMSTSLKARWEIFVWPPQWIPEVAHWENYVEAFTRYPMGRFVLNSTLLVIANLIGEFFSVPLIAYGFARLRFPGRNILFILMLATMMIPGHIKLIPLFTLYHRLGWIDTYWPLILYFFSQKQLIGGIASVGLKG